MIGAYLKETGITQTELIELIWKRTKVQVSKSLMSMWVNGHRFPNRGHANALEVATRGRLKSKSWDALQRRG